jgi:hypothetical protein
MSLYPNPVQDKLQLHSDQMISQVVVRNLLGQAVRIMTVNNTETTLDVSQMPTGNYVVSITFADGRVATRKIVKL